MDTALIVSNLVLWAIVIVLLLIVFALTRQIGVLHERVAPVGALMPMNGPKIGEQIAPMELTTLSGSPIHLGADGIKTFIYFLSPGCPVCKSLLPVVLDVENSEDFRLLFASDGETDATHRTYAAEHGLSDEQYLVSRDLGIAMAVNKLPFAVLIDSEGVLKGRGLVNNREHIESLMTADELDVSSVQEYLEQHER